jgi:hypothetical protein
MDAVYMHNALVANSPVVDGKKGKKLMPVVKMLTINIACFGINIHFVLKHPQSINVP